ncbi:MULTISPECIES: hypothetical protein [Metabacillus]|uniref:Uncharacterized protein n=1 Tax=Metabacillus hrfriensis TaxID=3048891 RepID=A0ACD4R682_9BACI|nr:MULTISPECIES: hypothetical protein [Metabacillus]UAL50479.1 hypothetical protein K8L98_14580 [Metabacillus dongyingensis]UOK56572.1 hypothetical protein MGI18_16955 [Bacillus sp. OVS6]WHZ55959.1 hypothetical protein QLQ22_14700 [Metabacillus sp. CT-WN-B3]
MKNSVFRVFMIIMGACVGGLIVGVNKGEFPLGVLAGFIVGGLLILFVSYLRKQKNNQSF